MAIPDSTNDIINSLLDTDQSIPDRPSQQLSGITERFLNIQRWRRLNSTVSSTNGNAILTVPSGAPQQIVSVTATESPVKLNSRMVSVVSISFIKDPADINFSSVRIWFKGYQGSSNYQLMPLGSSSDSPISIVVETTGETVVVAVQAVSSDGTAADLASCPTALVTLDGVVSAPPAPSVSQTCLPIFGGIQFAYTELSGLAADVIQAYKIYRNTVNTSGTATVIQTIPHNPQNAGTNIVVQDNQIIANVFYWYWVSAVNTSGLESTLTAAGTSAGNFGSPTETINLFQNPAMAGTGSLNSGFSNNFSYYQVGGSISVPEFRHLREIRIPFTSSGSSSKYCAVFQNLDRLRFKAGQAITISLRVRKDNGVGSPTGNFVMSIQPSSNAQVAIGTETILNQVPLTSISTDYTLYRGTTTVTPIGGQDTWRISFYNTSSNCDLYITEPMLNNGFDASPFTTNNFLNNVTQYQYEGLTFVQDDFTDTNGVGFGNTASSHLPTASGGAGGTGVGELWNGFAIVGSDVANIQSGKAQYQYSNTGVTGEFQMFNFYPTENNFGLSTQNSEIGHTVQADCVAGSGTGASAISVAGVIGKAISITAASSFYPDVAVAREGYYLAQIDSGGNIGLFFTTNSGTAYTSLGSFASGLSSATIKLLITSATKQVWVNGTPRITSSDNTVVPSVSTSGMDIFVGARFTANYTAISTKPSVDNFVATYVQNIASPPTPPTPGSGGSAPPAIGPQGVDYNPGIEPTRNII